MNPILQTALSSILRWALALAAGYLVKAGIWKASEAEVYISAAVIALLALGWSLWEKYKSRSKVLTALMMPAGSTENDLNTTFKTQQKPSVFTPPDTAPGVPDLKEPKI